MRQIVKRVKNGQEVKFICSICGEVIYCVFILAGEECEINWDKLPEKCSCGTKLANRQPIIDTDGIDTDGIDMDGIDKDGTDTDCIDTDGIDMGGIDTDGVDMNNMSENMRGNVHRNIYDNVRKDVQRTVSRDMSGNPDIYRRCMIDLENAISVDYFDMRLGGLKRGNCKIPDNIDHLRIECIKRNISYIESCMERSSYAEDTCDANELKEMLNILRQKYSDMSKKSEDKKGFDKRRRP